MMRWFLSLMFAVVLVGQTVSADNVRSENPRPWVAAAEGFIVALSQEQAEECRRWQEALQRRIAQCRANPGSSACYGLEAEIERFNAQCSG